MWTSRTESGEGGETGAKGMLSYSLIFAIAIFGLLHQPWWLAAAGALLLAATLSLQDRRVSARLTAAQAMELAMFASVARLSLCAAASSAAFVLGRICAWLFSL
jgi:hypothetical protein